MRYLLLILSMILAVIGQLFLKKGISLSTLTPNVSVIIKTLISPLVFLGFFLYCLSSIVWLFVLQKFPLSVAYPSLALTYIAILFFSALFFKESLTISKLFAVFLIFVGVLIINK